MILPKLAGRGLFVFSDPGGAKPILSYALLNSELNEMLLLSDRKYSFFQDFPLTIIAYRNESIRDIIENFRPDFVFTGTSYTSQIEIKFIKTAKEVGINTFSFVDHYTSFLERFRLNGKLEFPDNICVIDKLAENIAIEKGLANRTIITGNYYHEYLKKWKPAISKKKFLQNIGINANEKKICVYGPDPLSNKPKEKSTDFDEIDATRVLSKVAYQLRETHLFILNPHPNQDVKKIINECGDHLILILKPLDVNSLIFFADVVIGFFSNFLIEANVLQKPVLRFFLNKEMNDPLRQLNVGKVVYPENIISELKLIQ